VGTVQAETAPNVSSTSAYFNHANPEWVCVVPVFIGISMVVSWFVRCEKRGGIERLHETSSRIVPVGARRK
jgi:hypothetical protein